MKTIIDYFNGKRVLKIEVDEQIADCFAQSKRDEDRQEKRIERHHTRISLDQMEDDEYQVPDNNAVNPLDEIAEREDRKEKRAALAAGLKSLKAADRKLIVDAVIKKRPLKEIAAEMGITYQSVQDRIKVILKNLKKHFGE